jgi:hypothetical protein
MCDNCAKIIEEGEDCVAFSMYAEGIPYFEWEDQFVTRPPQGKAMNAPHGI